MANPKDCDPDSEYATVCRQWAQPTNWTLAKGLYDCARKRREAGQILRLVWLASFYDSFSELTGVRSDFKTAIHGIRHRILETKGIVRYAPTRSQVLGRMHENKRQAFGDFLGQCFGQDPQNGLDSYRPTDFLHGSRDQAISPLGQMHVRMLAEDWTDLQKFVERQGHLDIRLDLERKFSPWYRISRRQSVTS